MSDGEIDAVFRQMQALKVPIFTTNQTRVGMGPRVAPFSEKYGIKAAWHPHAQVNDPNEVATPESMEKLLGMSKAFVVNLDIGHYTAGNNDAVAFLRAHHDRITHLHVKDRKRDNGPNVQLGTGDTPIKECAALIRDNKWPIMLILEREYRDAPGTAVEQTRWQLNYLTVAAGEMMPARLAALRPDAQVNELRRLGAAVAAPAPAPAWAPCCRGPSACAAA